MIDRIIQKYNVKNIAGLAAYAAVADKAAFTLAEVLITLGIIGVVAAMTIPGLISKYQKSVIESTLKEDYSIFSQVNKLMVYNEAEFDMSAADGSYQAIYNWFAQNMLPYMQLSQICTNGQEGCWSDNLQTTMLNGNSFTDCKTGYGCGYHWLSFIMNNGTKVTMDIGNNNQLVNIFGIDSTASTCLKIYIDVNGDKKPNRFGIDVFLMTFTEDGFMPAGFKKTHEQLKANCSTTSTGYWCLTYVKNSNWKIPEDIWKSRNK